MTTHTVIEALRLANRSLRASLERWQSSQNAAAIRFRDFSALRSEIMHAANHIPSLSANVEWEDSDLEAEISEYRSNLQRLAQILPLVHVGLQGRRSRLQAALDHLQAAAAWAEASKKSL
jgi:hypothetical protein